MRPGPRCTSGPRSSVQGSPQGTARLGRRHFWWSCLGWFCPRHWHLLGRVQGRRLPARTAPPPDGELGGGGDWLPPGTLSDGFPEGSKWGSPLRRSGVRRPSWTATVCHGVVRAGTPVTCGACSARLAQCACSAPFPHPRSSWRLSRERLFSPVTATLGVCDGRVSTTRSLMSVRGHSWASPCRCSGLRAEALRTWTAWTDTARGRGPLLRLHHAGVGAPRLLPRLTGRDRVLVHQKDSNKEHVISGT